MKKLILIFLVVVSSVGFCRDSDSDFESLMNKFINEYFNLNPQTAVYLGIHEFDGKISGYDMGSLQAELSWSEEYLKKLSEIDRESLSKNNYINYQILLSDIKSTIFSLKQRRSFVNNPMTYAGVIDVNIYISRDFAPIEDRIRSIISIEKNSPEIFSAARNNLAEILPKPFVTTAIRIAKGSADFLSNDLIEALKDVKNETLMSEFNAANNLAIKELNDYAEYLEKEKLPKANDNFGIGRDLYVKMLEQEMISMTPEEILEYGKAKLKLEQQLFAETAKLIDPSKKAIDVFKDIQKDHPTAISLIPDTEKNTEAIRQFLIDNEF